MELKLGPLAENAGGFVSPKPAGRFCVFLPLLIRSVGIIQSPGGQSYVGCQGLSVRWPKTDGAFKLGDLRRVLS